MNISEYVAVISALFAFVALIFTVKNSKRTDTKDIEARVAENTKLNIKLDEIARSLAEIKEEFQMQKREIQTLIERMAKVEASASQAHKRLDRLALENGGNCHE